MAIHLASLQGNTFVRCGVGVALDDRGLTWDTANCPPGGPFQQDLESFDYVSVCAFISFHRILTPPG